MDGAPQIKVPCMPIALMGLLLGFFAFWKATIAKPTKF